MEDTLASLPAPWRKLKRSTQYHFVLYDGDPRNKGYQVAPKAHRPRAFEKLFDAAVANHNKEMDQLRDLIKYWQSVCRLLEQKSAKEMTSNETSQMTLSPSTAIDSGVTVGITQSSTGESISSTCMPIDDQATKQQANTETDVELPEMETEFLDVMWDYFENGAVLMWPGFRVTRKPSIRVRHHAWKLANGDCIDLGANLFRGATEEVVECGGCECETTRRREGEERGGVKRRGVVEGTLREDELGSANCGVEGQGIGMVAASARILEGQDEEKILELRADVEEGMERAVVTGSTCGGSETDGGEVNDWREPARGICQRCHESTQVLLNASTVLPQLAGKDVGRAGTKTQEDAATEKANVLCAGAQKPQPATDCQGGQREALPALLLRQPVTTLLSLAENLVFTTLGCVFWLEQRSQGPALAPGSFFGVPSSCALAQLTGLETDIRSIFDAYATHNINSSSHFLHLLLCQIKTLYETNAHPSDLLHLQRNPSLYTRFMHLTLSFSLLSHKNQHHIRTRLWIDFAFWLAKSGSFASHLPLFNTTRQRIYLFLLKLGTYGHLEWLQLLETIQALCNGPTASPYNWIDDGLSEFYTWSMDRSFDISKSELGEPEIAKMTNWLNEQHIGWIWKNWQSMKGWVDWIWVYEADSAQEAHQKAQLQKKKLGLAIEPRISTSKPEYEVPHDIWPKFSLPEGFANDEPESTDSSETLEVEKEETPLKEQFLPPWFNVSLVSMIIILISAAVDYNYADVGLCMEPHSDELHQDGNIFKDHPWFGATSSWRLRRQISQTRKAWAALLMICGWWISTRASDALEDEIIMLRLQYHLVASQLTGLVHRGTKSHIKACMDLLKPYRAEHRTELMESVRDKVCGAEMGTEGCPYDQLSLQLHQLRVEEAKSVSSTTYQSECSELNTVRAKFSKSKPRSSKKANVLPPVDFDIAIFDTNETNDLPSDDWLGEAHASMDFTSLFNSDESNDAFHAQWPNDPKDDSDTALLPHEANCEDVIFPAPYGYSSDAMDLSREPTAFDVAYSDYPRLEPVPGDLAQLAPEFDNKFEDPTNFTLSALGDNSHEAQQFKDYSVENSTTRPTKRKKRSTPNGTPLVNRRKRGSVGPAVTGNGKRSTRKPKQLSV